MSAGGQLQFGFEPSTNRPALDVSPTTLNFGNVDILQTSNQVVMLTNTGNAPVQVTATSNNGRFLVTPQAATLAAGANQPLQVSFAPGVTGAANGTVR